jgi:hypothetical protein
MNLTRMAIIELVGILISLSFNLSFSWTVFSSFSIFSFQGSLSALYSNLEAYFNDLCSHHNQINLSMFSATIMPTNKYCCSLQFKFSIIEIRHHSLVLWKLKPWYLWKLHHWSLSFMPTHSILLLHKYNSSLQLSWRTTCSSITEILHMESTNT